MRKSGSTKAKIKLIFLLLNKKQFGIVMNITAFLLFGYILLLGYIFYHQSKTKQDEESKQRRFVNFIGSC